jgi:predicted DNA binding CopG/RHH family protein
MKNQTKIPTSAEAWESGELGQDEDYVKQAENVDIEAIDRELELQMISIRLQKSLIEDFKMIAKVHGLGYQPLIRQVLKRFADSEKNRLLRKIAAQVENGNNGMDEEAKKVVGQ